MTEIYFDTSKQPDIFVDIISNNNITINDNNDNIVINNNVMNDNIDDIVINNNSDDNEIVNNVMNDNEIVNDNVNVGNVVKNEIVNENIDNKKKMIDEINNLTKKLNNSSEENTNNLRQRRKDMINKLLPLVKDNEKIFLMPFCTTKPIYVSKNVALVGNAYDLLEQKYGEEIDSFDTVIRFNSCVVKGYEKHVGSKLTHLFCTSAYYNNTREKVSFEKDKVYVNKIDTKDFRNIDVIGIYSKPSQIKTKYRKTNQYHSSVNISHYYHHLTFQNDILKSLNSKIVNDCKSTAGISILLSLVDLGLKPTIYGFTHTLDNEYRTYYWPEVIRDKRNNKTHNFVKEYHILTFLIKKNLVNFIGKTNYY